MVALRDYYEANDISKVGNYTVEIYPTPRSRFWLSAAYEQDVVKFDMFWFGKNKGDPAAVFYPQFWEIMKKFDCRFHWGKYMPIDPAYLSARYPRWDEFMTLRQQLDPNQVFVTDYWRERLGIRLQT
jgi:FAD/FMN-containing dehydrogenase